MLYPIFRWAFLGFVVTVLLAGGAGSDATANVFLIVLLGALVLSLPLSPIRQENGQLYNRCLLVSMILSVYVAFQILPIDYSSFAQSAGIGGRDLLVRRDWLSVAPGDSLQALFSVLIPFVACLLITRICPSGDDAARLFQHLLIAGIAIGSVTFAQHMLAPDLILLQEKRYYLKDFTASFIGKNIAGNFFGILLVGTVTYWGRIVFRRRDSRGGRAHGQRQRRRVSPFWSYLLAIAIGLILLLLIRTGSRAGAVFAVNCALGSLAICFLRQYRRPADFGYGKLAAIGVVIFIALVFSLDPLISRFNLHGWDNLRACFFRSTWNIIRDHWLFGTGLGTFPHVYPLYRLPGCGLSGVLIRAHSFFLEGWASLGVIFVILTGYVLLRLGMWYVAAMQSSSPGAWIPQAGFFILVFELAHNAIDFSIQNAGVALYAASMLTTAYLAVGVASEKMPAGKSREKDDRDQPLPADALQPEGEPTLPSSQ
jgi:hypothetical protein